MDGGSSTAWGAVLKRDLLSMTSNSSFGQPLLRFRLPYRRGLKRIAWAALLVAALTPARTAAQESGSAIVRCLDEGRGTVRETARDQCRGRVITAEEAERLRDARDARINRIVRGSDRPPGHGDQPVPARQGLRRGTGFFIAADGTLLTNRHVADGCRTLSITLNDGRTVPAELRAVAAGDDIAVLSAQANVASFARFTTAPDLTSDALAVVGYPQNSPTPSVATMASARRGTADLLIGRHFYALPGSVRPGHSGSPVLDRAGNVVGMVVASIRRRGVPMSDVPGPDERIAAIPNATVTSFLVQRGVSYQSAPPAREWTEAQLLERARHFVVRVNCTI